MHVPSVFSVHPAVALAFAAARGFGLVIACEACRPVATLVPFDLIESHGKSPRVVFHLACNNPMAAAAQKGGDWLIAIEGDDAYVSANWYASEHQVPTWLYETVQLGGPVRVIAGDGEHVAALSARFEAGLDAPWSPAKLPPERFSMLLKTIVVIEMQVETIEGSFKLNQHKSDADHVGVTRALAAQDHPGARAIARRMVALRPHLLYEDRQSEQAMSAARGGGT